MPTSYLPLRLLAAVLCCCVSVHAHGYIAGWAIDGDWVTLPRSSAYFGVAAVSSTRQRWVTGPFYDLDSADMACGQFNGGSNATISREARAGALGLHMPFAAHADVCRVALLALELVAE